MKIAVVSSLYYPDMLGGAERSIKELCEELVARGNQVRVYCLGHVKTAEAIEPINGVEVIRIPSRAYDVFAHGGVHSDRISKAKWHLGEILRIRTNRNLRHELEGFEPDVIHINNIAGFGWLGWLAVRKWTIVHTLRDYYLLCLSSTGKHGEFECYGTSWICKIARLPFRWTASVPGAFVGVSNSMLDVHVNGGYRKIAGKRHTIYNSPQVATSPPLDQAANSAYTFGLLGRIGADKGTWLALDAYEQLPERISGLAHRLVVAGAGGDEDVETLRKRANENARIEYVGLVDPSKFLTSLNCLIVPTQWAEPFGRVAAEGFQSGLSVLASNIGGLPEVFELYNGPGNLISDYKEASAWTAEMFSSVEGGWRKRRPLPAAGEDVTDAYLRLYTSLLHS